MQTITVFSLSALLFYAAALLLFGKLAPEAFKKNLYYRKGGAGFTWHRLQEADKAEKVDILFAGSSHAYGGFDTRVFKQYGFTSFNIGTSAQTPVQTEILLKRVLTKMSPRVVVYEVYPFTFSSDGVESSLDLIANSRLDVATLKMAAAVNNIKTYNSLLYALLCRTFFTDNPVNTQRSFYLERDNIHDDFDYIPGGYVQRQRYWVSDSTVAESKTKDMFASARKAMLTEIAQVQTKDGRWKPAAFQLKAFERILATLKQKNIRVVLVQTPINHYYYNLIRCNKNIDQYFSSKAAYYNLNEGMQFDDATDFVDYDHLNQQGVEKMNAAFIKQAFSKN